MTDSDDHRELDLLLRGFAVARMLRLVADLGVADRIAPEGQMPVADLAVACGVMPRQLLRVLRALAAFGIFAVTTDERIAHTGKSSLLRTDAPNSLHHSARFWTRPGRWAAWGALDAAMTGEVPHEVATGLQAFAYLRAHPDEARIFDTMMANTPDHRHAAVADAYDFSEARLIADIGGGNGEALRQILARYPGARGLVFDVDHVVAAIPEAAGMAGRITTQSGSFFDGVPTGADFYLMVRVLHDWSDEDCRRILRNCRAAVADGARLLVCERLLDPDPLRGDPTDYLMDVQMMVFFGAARERSEAEFRALLADSGFDLRRVIPTASQVVIMEAVPV